MTNSCAFNYPEYFGSIFWISGGYFISVGGKRSGGNLQPPTVTKKPDDRHFKMLNRLTAYEADFCW